MSKCTHVPWTCHVCGFCLSRILLYFPLCVDPSVRHRRDISVFLHCVRLWTIQSIYFLKAHDNHYPLHWPTHHSLITQPGPSDPQNPPNLNFSPLNKPNIFWKHMTPVYPLTFLPIYHPPWPWWHWCPWWPSWPWWPRFTRFARITRCTRFKYNKYRIRTVFSV